MAESIYVGRKGLFFALETVEGTYVAPTATAFIMTEDFQYTPVVKKSDTVTLDSLDNSLVAKEMISSRSTGFQFKVPFSWPAVAPAAGLGYLPVSPLLEACGALTPAFVAAVVGPPANPANNTYGEQSSLELIKSGSLSFRQRRSASAQLEKKSAGVRGSVGFDWELNKVPRFNFDMVGSHLAMVSSANLAQTPGAQLTNMAAASSAATVATATLGTKALCLTKFSIKNLFRHKADWTTFSCGERAQPSAVLDNDITITCKMPNIDTEFNPDAFHGNEYPFVFRIDQLIGGRFINFNYANLQLIDWKPTAIGSEMGLDLTFRQISPLVMTTE